MTQLSMCVSGHIRTEFVIYAMCFLLIEVSDTTLDYARDRKLPLCGRAVIAEVWVAHLIESRFEVYAGPGSRIAHHVPNREPHFGGYSSKAVLRPGDQAAPLAFPDATSDIAGLLKC